MLVPGFGTQPYSGGEGTGGCSGGAGTAKRFRGAATGAYTGLELFAAGLSGLGQGTLQTPEDLFSSA